MTTFRYITIILMSLVSHSIYAADNMFNIKTAPVSALIGITNIELDIAVSEHITVGPSYSAFNFDHSDVDYDADVFGVRMNY